MNYYDRLIHILVEEQTIEVKTVTSKDGHHNYFGTKHKNPKDSAKTRKEKQKHVEGVKNSVTGAMDIAHKAGKSIHFHNEGEPTGAEGTHEREIHDHAKAHAEKHGMTMHSKSAERGKLPHPEVTKDDSKRDRTDYRRHYPRDHGGAPTEESKKIDANNRHRQAGFAKNAKDAHIAGHASIHIGGEGHVGKDTARGHENHGTHGVKL